MSLTQDEQVVKAAKIRAGARAKPSNLLETLEEALAFVERHSEEWYYSGQELCGRLECEIEQVQGLVEGVVEDRDLAKRMLKAVDRLEVMNDAVGNRSIRHRVSDYVVRIRMLLLYGENSPKK